jgi:hypothetical protein
MNTRVIFKGSGRAKDRKSKGKNHRCMDNDHKYNALAARIQHNKRAYGVDRINSGILVKTGRKRKKIQSTIVRQ